MACEVSRRPREGSPLIPGLIWRFALPCYFGQCHWQLQPSCVHLSPSVVKRCVKRRLSPVHNGCARSRSEGRVSNNTTACSLASICSKEWRAQLVR